MKRLAGALLTAVALAVVPASAAPAPPLTPAAQWDVSGARIVDVTCDGRSDVVMTGHRKKVLYVSVVTGGSHRRAFDFRFAIGRSEQAAVCALPVHVVTQPLSCEDDEYGHLEGCRPERRCTMFAVEDGECDSLWFYWNAKARRIDWFRH